MAVRVEHMSFLHAGRGRGYCGALQYRFRYIVWSWEDRQGTKTTYRVIAQITKSSAHLPLEDSDAWVL